MANQDGLLQAGDRLGAYRVERKLGSGGMADVYFAVHQELDRPAALKVLRASLATDETHLQRFMQEARAAAALIHPNIVQVYDVGREDERRYIAQEYVAGSNLRDYLAVENALPESTVPLSIHTTPVDDAIAGRESADGAASHNPDQPATASHDRQLDIREVLSILLQVLAAVSKSASSGIVHRDIKPENIMLTTDGEAKVADFGLARVLLGDDPNLTRAGTTLGTPMYMSPEQIQDGKVDIRSDLYSLGVTLYHMLAGQPPYTGESPLAIAMQHVQAKIPDVRELRDGLPESLAQLTSRLLAKQPGDRFADPAEVLQFLQVHRRSDLADFWPDQAVPLPGVSAAGSRGPMRETLALQSILRKQRSASARMWAGYAAMFLLPIGLFFVGFSFASSPALLAELPEAPANMVEELEDAREQYKAAMFSEAPGLEKWRAVGKYFGDEPDDFNLYWVGLADLQIARQLKEEGKPKEAKRELDRMIARMRNSDQPLNLVLAFAYLVLTDVALADSAAGDPTVSMQSAGEIYSDLGPRDQSKVDRYAKALSLELDELWSSDPRRRAP